MNLQHHVFPSPTLAANSMFATGQELAERTSRPAVVVVVGRPLAAGTSSAQPMRVWADPYVWLCEPTTDDRVWTMLADQDRPAGNSSEFTSDAIAELRRTSGLTWDQIGRLFGVSRRSVHFWASGKPMNVANEQHLLQVLDVVRRADRGDARSNRAVLFEVSADGTPFDLLASKRFDEAGALLGRGPGSRRLTLRPLDAKAAAERTPLPPEALIDAMNDRVHRDVGRVRPARTVRNVRRESPE